MTTNDVQRVVGGNFKGTDEVLITSSLVGHDVELGGVEFVVGGSGSDRGPDCDDQ